MILHEVARRVYVATSRVYATTTTIVVEGDQALLVDPALLPIELTDLATVLRAHGWTVTAALATHAHWDHVMWTPEFGDAPRYASPATVREALRERNTLVADAEVATKGPLPDEVAALVGVPLVPLRSDAVPWPGMTARLVVHDGHAPGHTAVWLPDQRVLLAGDMLSNLEIPLLDLDSADPVGSYITGLDRIDEVAHSVRVIVPGHGGAGGPTAYRARMAADLRYLDALAAGNHTEDPRLDDPAMRAEHERAVAALESV